MKQDNPVPKLDLAPRLKRPLSLWNPLDYFRLLYWVFYFPQALRWYIDTFGGGYIEPTLTNWGKRWKLRLQNPIQRNLQIQELLLIFFIPLILYGLFLFEPNSKEIAILLILVSVIFSLLLNLIWDIGLGIASIILLNIIPSILFDATYVINALEFEKNVISGLEVLWGAIAVISVCGTPVVGIGVTSAVVFSLVSGVTSKVVSSAILGVISGVTFGMASGVIIGLFYFADSRITSEVASGVIIGVILSVMCSVIFSMIFDLVWVIFSIFSKGLINGVLYSVIVGIVYGATPGIISATTVTYDVYEVVYFLGIGLVCSVTLTLVLLRLENWLINIVFNLTRSRSSVGKIAHVTLLPNYSLMDKLQNWLQKDWAIGISNVNQILKYTLQLAHVVPPIKRVLLKFPDEQVIYRVNQLVEGTNNWKLIRSLVEFNSEIASFATTNGFWYLHEKQPDQATEAFSVLRNLLYGEELFILAHTLNMFQQAKEVNKIANLTFPKFPRENLLRPITWQTMNSLRRVVDNIKLIQHSASRNAKSSAYSRAIGELAEVINNQEQILESERALIVNIAQTWKQSLEKIGKEIGDVAITKPVRNPYVIGNPVKGSLFVGREDILRQLEELWIMGNQLQSVVLYGHRRMGKTSILVNIANNTGSEITVVYLNLQRLGEVSQGVAEVLIAISDAIAKQLDIPSPEDEAFLKLPQRTFERYLEQVIENMSYRGMIIALDEFETIEELIKLGQLDARFMGFLRGLIQINPTKLAFVFAGLHTLEEMTADYFEPFFASVIPINVGFFSAGATKTLLANPASQDISITQTNQENSDNPDHDFLLDYTGEALDLIYKLTSGQPYLIQLIGFLLVRNYNDQVFEQGNSRNSTFTIEDVEAVITNNLFQQGRYYFEGVWGQAKQGAPGQQEIIAALAPHPEGISKDELISATGLDLEQLTAAIDTLKRHDVIEEKDGNYRIIVELFRRWVINNQ